MVARGANVCKYESRNSCGGANTQSCANRRNHPAASVQSTDSLIAAQGPTLRCTWQVWSQYGGALFLSAGDKVRQNLVVLAAAQHSALSSQLHALR
jgi:hypothetical protein